MMEMRAVFMIALYRSTRNNSPLKKRFTEKPFTVKKPQKMNHHEEF